MSKMGHFMRFNLVILAMGVMGSLPLFAQKSLKYSKDEKLWLQKVDIIITKKERSYFRKDCTTHQQRQEFMEVFWARRDADLHDGKNEFRDEYLARVDYVDTHFKTSRKYVPRTDRGIIYLLLGPPTKIEKRIDYSLVGFDFRSDFLGYTPELWIYNPAPYGLTKKEIKIQMIPINRYGDYRALADTWTLSTVQNLKFRFIQHPDMFRTPVDPVNVTDMTTKISQPPPTPDAPEPATDEEESGIAASTAATAAVPLPVAPPKATELTVPTTIEATTTSALSFNNKLPNNLGVRGQLAYFKNTSEKNLLLGRLGFPMKSMKFEKDNSQYKAPFTLIYSLEDAEGQTVVSESFDGELMVPDQSVLDRNNNFYTKEFAILLSEDRYKLKMQVIDKNSQKSAYNESIIDVPELAYDYSATNELRVLDPNINPAEAKFQIEGTPYGLHLTHIFTVGDTMLPIIEIVGPAAKESRDNMVFSLVADGKEAKKWRLFAEELTTTNQNTRLVHPRLSTKDLAAGKYRLRFDLESKDGDILTSETEIELKHP